MLYPCFFVKHSKTVNTITVQIQTVFKKGTVTNMNLPNCQIADGVKISCLDTDKFKVNSIAMNIELPLTIENITFANLLSRVLRRGCQRYPDIRTLASKLDELYGADISTSVLRTGESQYLCFFADFLVEKYTDTCDIINEICALLGEMVFSPLVKDSSFDKEYVDSERKNLSDDIKALINNKAAYAKFRCTEKLCEGEAYSLHSLGDIEILNSITPKDLYEFYTRLLRESRIELLYSGDGEYFEKAAAAIKEIFKSADRAYRPCKSSIAVKALGKPLKEISEDMPVNQGKLCIGMRTGITNKSDNIAGLIVANEIFGSSPSSKLFMNVREKMSLCYYCSSNIDAIKGVMFVNAGIESENYEVARDAILSQLDAVKNGDFTDEELNNAIIGLVNGYKSIYDNIASLETWYMSRIFRNEDDTPESRIRQIKEITRKEVMSAAEKISPEVIFFLRGTLKEDDFNE